MKQYNLYAGKIVLDFNEEKHLYTIDNKHIPGCTSILQVIAKPALFYWGINQTIEYIKENIKAGQALDELQLKSLLQEARWAHKKKKDTAADIGTFVHQWCEDYIKGLKPALPINESIKNGVNAFLNWKKENKVKFHLSEQIVYSKKYNYAGTFDFYAEVNGKNFLGDFKTSSGIYPEMFFQTAAYQMARQEEYPKEKYDGNLILRLGKDGEFEAKESYEYDKNCTAFCAAVALHKRMQELTPKYNA